MKKICLKLSVIFFLGLAMVFGIGKNAKAAIEYNGESYANDANGFWSVPTDTSDNRNMYHYIPDTCANRIVVLQTGSYDKTVVSATYGGAAMTLLETDNIIASAKSTVYYIVNPPTGTSTITVDFSGREAVVMKAVSFCNVDQSSPISSSDINQIYNYPNGDQTLQFPVADDDSAVLIFSNSVGYGKNITLAAGYTKTFGNANTWLHWTPNTVLGYKIGINTNANYQTIVNFGGTGYDATLGYLVLKYQPSEYCGDGLCQSATEDTTTCPDDCGYPSSAETSILFFFSNPYLRNNQSTARIRYVYNEDIFTPYDYISIYQIDPTNWASSTFIGTSTVIDYNELGGQKQGGQSYLSLTGSSTYTGLMNYDIVAHFASYWSASTGQTVPASESDPWVLVVNWTSANDIPLPSWNFATTTVLGDDFNTHDLACSTDEWNATTTLGINPHLCSFKQWLLDIGVKPTTYIISKISGLKSQIMTMFPFSLFKTINDSWTTATNSLSRLFLPIPVYAADTYSTSTGIYSGSGDGYSMDIPQFLGTTGTTSIPILSKASLTNILGDTGFLIYYYTCRFFIWALTLIFFWSLITERADKELL